VKLPAQNKTAKTKVKDKTLHPVWEEQFSLYAPHNIRVCMHASVSCCEISGWNQLTQAHSDGLSESDPITFQVFDNDFVSDSRTSDTQIIRKGWCGGSCTV
jgi:hypothetical protein